MRRILQSLSLLLLLSIALSAPVAATCGGGGGGGLGGFPSGPGPEAQTYQVPWKVVGDDGKPAAGNLVVLWFPTSPDQARRSSLQSSRNLTLWSARCVGMALVPGQETALHTQYTVTGEAVVLTDRAGKEVGRLAGGEKWLFANDVEKLVGGAIKKLEDSLDGKLDAAKEKEKGGDVEGAASLYSEVFADRCLSPGSAKKAAKALRKLGKPVPEDQAMLLDLPQPDFSPAVADKVINALDEGLRAERGERYEGARGWYLAARRIDPGDPVPLRYLGELYRHHTGEWVEARQVFEEILRRPSDPLSRAVALHGLGKMTIHEGNSPKGLSLFEESVATYPLALAYRNLAVFWNSEGKRDKAKVYVDKALALDPDEPFNKIFAATYLVEDGKAAEALRIAQQNDSMMAASYNLAAIYAMSGQRDKALALLQRHFFEYEKYDPVRAHEMKEAREDIVFKTLHADPAFIDLTKQALPPAHGMPGAAATTPNGG
jgi:tetratricopeptide (TPR) repeat protein